MAIIKQVISKISGIRSQVPIAYHGIIIGLYTILTVLLTHPVLSNMAGAIMGSGDAWQVLYILWYTKQALLGGDPNLTMTYTNYIFYPHGIPMIFSAFSMFDQLIGVPLQLLFGLIATFNILWLLSFILAGYGAFLLVRYLTGNDTASFVSGIIFTFSPYHFGQAQMHMGATTIEWIPFCALFLMKMFRERSLKNAFLAGIFFIMVALSDSQYMMYMGIFAGLLFLYEAYCIFREKTEVIDQSINIVHALRSKLGTYKDMLVRYAVFAVTSLIVCIPLNYEMLRIATSGNDFLYLGTSWTENLSGDLIGFFVPSPLHPIFGEWVAANIYPAFTANSTEYVIFAGWTVLALSLFAIVVRRKETEVKFWALSTIFFMFMVLGPKLHIMGTVTIPIYPGYIPLPYTIVDYLVPFLMNSRTPIRFDVVVMLSLAVLAGYGLARLMAIVNTRTTIKIPGKGMIVAYIFAGLILFEFMTLPTISLVDTPAFYQQIGQDKSSYALLEIPAASTSYSASLKTEYYETISDKPIVGGTAPRIPGDASDFVNNTPLINDLTYSDTQYEIDNDIFNQNETDIGNYVLEYYNIRYVVLNVFYMIQNGQYRAIFDDMHLLNATLNESPTYEEDNLIVYQVNPTQPKLFMVPGDGFYTPESDGVTTWRWTGKSSSLDIVSPKESQYDLSFDVAGFVPDTLNVSMNGTQLLSQPLAEEVQHIVIPVSLNKGDNIVVFNGTEDIGQFTSTYDDTVYQYPSFKFSNVSVEPADDG